MARTNVRPKAPKAYTHEGGKAYKQEAKLELTKAVLGCMLFEDQFYRPGVDMASRIWELCDKVSPQFVAELALTARNDIHLRSVPMFLMVKALSMQDTNGSKDGLGELIADVIQRPDEMGEIISLFWKQNPGTKMIPNQLKVGLRMAIRKFNAYQLAKHDYNSASVKVRDVLRLVHPKPRDEEQALLWKSVIDDTLPVPDTWETALSGGADKKETFERLIREKKLGYMALLRNLRNMQEANCDIDLIAQALSNKEQLLKSKLMPFRFLPAWKVVTSSKLKSAVEQAFLAAAQAAPSLNGTTIVVVDVSGSMHSPVSHRSEVSLIDAAAAVAAILKENSSCLTYTFSNQMVKVHSTLHGMKYMKAVVDSQEHGGTYLSKALSAIENDPCTRIIVLTDEQSADGLQVKCWAKYGYVVNLAGYTPSIVNKDNGWQAIGGGWSDKILNYIAAYENFAETGSLDKVEDEEKEI